MSPYHICYDPVLACYFITEVGAVTYQDALKLLKLQTADPNYRTAKRILSDVRLTRLQMTASEHMHIAERSVPPSGAHVAVVVRPGRQFALYTKIKQLHVHLLSMEVFLTMEDARTWLGISL